MENTIKIKVTKTPKKIDTQNNESNSLDDGLDLCITAAPKPKSLRIFKNPVNTKIIAITPKSSGLNNLDKTEVMTKVNKSLETLSIIDHEIPVIVLLFILFNIYSLFVAPNEKYGKI